MTRVLHQHDRLTILRLINRMAARRPAPTPAILPATSPAVLDPHFKAAIELQRAADTLRVLQWCERATGGVWANDQDCARLRTAVDRWAGRTRVRRARGPR